MSPDACDIQTLFTYAPFAVYALLFPLFILSNSFLRRTAILLALFFAVACAKYLGYKVLGGAVFVPDLPDKLIWTWDYLFMFSMALFGIQVAFLPVSFLVMKLNFHMPWCVRAQILPIIAAVLAAIVQVNALSTPEVHEVEYVSPDLPAHLDGYRIVQLSDLHISSAAKRWRTEKVVELANAQKADLIVVTGDIVDGLPDRLADDVEPLRNLTARDGVYFSCGNHEFYFDWFAWKRKYDEWGLKFLRNECVEVTPGITLAGIDDHKVELIDGEDPSVVKAFENAQEGTFRILLKHRPGEPVIEKPRTAKPKPAKPQVAKSGDDEDEEESAESKPAKSEKSKAKAEKSKKTKPRLEMAKGKAPKRKMTEVKTGKSNGGRSETAKPEMKPGKVKGKKVETRAERSKGDTSAILAEKARDENPGRYDLQLSGHTHGGIAPGLKEVVSLKNDGYVKGLYEVGGHGLFVHSGSGQWPAFEVRLFNSSEIAVITLKIPRGN